MDFVLVIALIVLIFMINMLHLFYVMISKDLRHHSFFRLILINSSFSSLITAVWLIPLFYFRCIWPATSLLWRLWSFLFHLMDGVQLYSLLLLITNSNTLPVSFQRLFICLSWIAPGVTYSPLLWWSVPHDKIDYFPYRRLSLGVPPWILSSIYISMYLIPICISLILTGGTICWPWIRQCHKKRVIAAADREANEHRENMAELTSLVDTVLSFELDQSSTDTLHVRISRMIIAVCQCVCLDVDPFHLVTNSSIVSYRSDLVLIHVQ